MKRKKIFMKKEMKLSAKNVNLRVKLFTKHQKYLQRLAFMQKEKIRMSVQRRLKWHMVAIFFNKLINGFEGVFNVGL